MSSPLEQYLFASCDVYRTILPSSDNFAPLVARFPEFLDCNPDYGIKVDLDFLNNATIQQDDDMKYSGPLLHGVSTLSALHQHFQETKNATGLTISAWIMPAVTDTKAIQPILTLGRLYGDVLYHQGCPGYDMLVAQYHENVLVSYTDSDPL